MLIYRFFRIFINFCTFEDCCLFLTVLATTAISLFRSSRPEVFCEKGILRIFTKFTGKRMCQSLFFNKVAGISLQLYWKGDSGTGGFLCRNICKNTFSYRTPPVTPFIILGMIEIRYKHKLTSYNYLRSVCTLLKKNHYQIHNFLQGDR